MAFHSRLALSAFLIINLTACFPGSKLSTDDPDGDRLHIETGLNYLNQKQYEKSIKFLERARPFISNNERALLALAIASDLTGDFKRSDRAYAHLMLIGADKAILFNNMGYSFMLRGDFENAAQYLTEASKIEPENATISNNFAMLKKVTPL